MSGCRVKVTIIESSANMKLSGNGRKIVFDFLIFALKRNSMSGNDSTNMRSACFKTVFHFSKTNIPL